VVECRGFLVKSCHINNLTLITWAGFHLLQSTPS
jgi:hypothetical protein